MSISLFSLFFFFPIQFSYLRHWFYPCLTSFFFSLVIPHLACVRLFLSDRLAVGPLSSRSPFAKISSVADLSFDFGLSLFSDALCFPFFYAHFFFDSNRRVSYPSFFSLYSFRPDLSLVSFFLSFSFTGPTCLRGPFFPPVHQDRLLLPLSTSSAAGRLPLLPLSPSIFSTDPASPKRLNFFFLRTLQFLQGEPFFSLLASVLFSLLLLARPTFLSRFLAPPPPTFLPLV